MAQIILLLALTLAVTEGAIRKWVIGSEAGAWSYLAYFSKDVLFASLLLLPRLAGSRAALEVFRKSVVVGGGLLVIGDVIAACRNFNPVGAALTCRATIVLPAIACAVVTRLAGLRLLRVMIVLALLTCFNCGLGIAQNHLPAEHVLNRYVSSETGVSVLETGVRATGTFSYITGLALMSAVGIWVGVSMASLGRARRWAVAGAVTVMAGVGCGLATVSRGPLIIGALVLAIWGCHSYGRAALPRLAWALSLMAAAGLMLGLVSGVGRMATAVLERHAEDEGSFYERVFGQFSQMLSAAFVAPLGQGLGTEQVAANYAATGISSFTTFEDQMPRLILESGVLGAAGFIIICGGAIGALQVAKRSTVDPRLQSVLVATQALLACLFYTNVVFNHTASAFAWMIFAAVMTAVSQAVSPGKAPLASAPYSLSGNHFRRARFAH